MEKQHQVMRLARAQGRELLALHDTGSLERDRWLLQDRAPDFFAYYDLFRSGEPLALAVAGGEGLSAMLVEAPMRLSPALDCRYVNDLFVRQDCRYGTEYPELVRAYCRHFLTSGASFGWALEAMPGALNGLGRFLAKEGLESRFSGSSDSLLIQALPGPGPAAASLADNPDWDEFLRVRMLPEGGPHPPADFRSRLLALDKDAQLLILSEGGKIIGGGVLASPGNAYRYRTSRKLAALTGAKAGETLPVVLAGLCWADSEPAWNKLTKAIGNAAFSRGFSYLMARDWPKIGDRRFVFTQRVLTFAPAGSGNLKLSPKVDPFFC